MIPPTDQLLAAVLDPAVTSILVTGACGSGKSRACADALRTAMTTARVATPPINIVVVPWEFGVCAGTVSLPRMDRFVRIAGNSNSNSNSNGNGNGNVSSDAAHNPTLSCMVVVVVEDVDAAFRQGKGMAAAVADCICKHRAAQTNVDVLSPPPHTVVRTLIKVVLTATPDTTRDRMLACVQRACCVTVTMPGDGSNTSIPDDKSSTKLSAQWWWPSSLVAKAWSASLIDAHNAQDDELPAELTMQMRLCIAQRKTVYDN
jgi:hypothetical protein